MRTEEFERKLAEAARAPILLVATDYDGTLAPIVEDPSKALPHREAIVALRMLSILPQTHVAVISGRALKDLAELTGLPEDVHLVGSHGSEFDLDFATSLPPEAAELHRRLVADLSEIASRDDGFIIEKKPASVAFHYRNAPTETAKDAVSDVLAGPATMQGVFTKHGKEVVELSVVSTNKGEALTKVRHRVGASAVVFLGDDRTDEDAFNQLKGPDVAVKVGEGETSAPFRVKDPGEVARVLARLCELRCDWLEGSEAVPIEQHSILTDQRTVALLTPRGRVTWLCVPRIDSSSIFAELCGGPTAGYFSVEPADRGDPNGQAYDDDSFILRTKWDGFTVTDFLDCSSGRPRQRAGRTELIRIVEGSGRVVVEFAPRLDFGRIATKISARADGLELEDTHDPIVLRAPGVEWTIIDEGDNQTARAEIELTDEPLVFELRYGTGSLREGGRTPENRCALTERYWATWAERLSLPPVKTELVRRSALALKSLCYGPTGAIAAAATTSLPEHVGGVRNWDYRYCWLRDAAMSAATLVKLGSIYEAMNFLDWCCGVVEACESPERLYPLYTVRGHELGPEAEIGELSGYRGSRPVRIGNAASSQVQLDVFGPIVELIAQLARRDAPLSTEHWRLVDAMVQAVERRWHEPDHGIWEIRKPRRHHVHSKVMCWLTVDRAIDIAEHFLDRDRPEWRHLRQTIASDVLEKGYKPEINAFTAAYDGSDHDAASLWVGLSGLLAPDDDRFQGTIRAIEEHLLEGPTVYRYRADDGLPGYEGGWHLCASWLIEAYLISGREADARTLFEDMCNLAGPTGLLSEQYGARSKRALGNFPQAYSHLGLIECALRLADLDDRNRNGG